MPTEAEVASAPWSAGRRRRRFEVEPPSPAAPGSQTSPPVAVAAYEAALLAQSVAVPVLFEIRPPAAKPQNLGVVDLLDSDDEAPASKSSAPATTMALAATSFASPATTATAPPPNAATSTAASSGVPSQAALDNQLKKLAEKKLKLQNMIDAKNAPQAPVPMDVVELDDSDNEADLNHRPLKLPRSSPSTEAQLESSEPPLQQEAQLESSEPPLQQEVLAPGAEDGSAEAHIDPYLLMASTEVAVEAAVVTTPAIRPDEVRYSDRVALVEQLIEEAEAEAEAEEEINKIAQQGAIMGVSEIYTGGAQVDEAVKMADEVDEAGQEDSSSEYTSCTDSSEEDGEDKTALAALAAVAQAAEQRAQSVFQ